MAEKIYQGFPNHALLAIMATQPEDRVLDLGCGAGDNAALLAQRGCRVWGVTYAAAEAELARRSCEAVEVADLDQAAPPESFSREYDLVLASHVLEHLHLPQRVLAWAGASLRPGGRVYIAVPNMAQWDLRWRFVRGDWSRTDFGPMDRTHLHFFSFATALDLLSDTGLRLCGHYGGDAKCPWRGISSISRKLSRHVDDVLGRRWPSLYAHQTFLIAEKPAAVGARI